MKKYRICIWGDSFVRWAWDREMLGWVSRLRKYFDNQQEKNVDIYNAGISGDTSADLLARFNLEAEIRKSKTRINIFIIEIGINDAEYLLDRQQTRVSLTQFQDNLKNLHLSAQEIADTVIFIGLAKIQEVKVSPTPWNKNHAFHAQDVLVYNQTLQKFCKDNNILFIDIFDLLDFEDLEDGCHPNAQWHQKIYIKTKDFLLDNQII